MGVMDSCSGVTLANSIAGSGLRDCPSLGAGLSDPDWISTPLGRLGGERGGAAVVSRLKSGDP